MYSEISAGQTFICTIKEYLVNSLRPFHRCVRKHNANMIPGEEKVYHLANSYITTHKVINITSFYCVSLQPLPMLS